MSRTSPLAPFFGTTTLGNKLDRSPAVHVAARCDLNRHSGEPTHSAADGAGISLGGTACAVAAPAGGGCISDGPAGYGLGCDAVLQAPSTTKTTATYALRLIFPPTNRSRASDHLISATR